MMPEYGVYIAASYGFALLVLLWLLLSSLRGVRQADSGLKQLQSALGADSEESMDSPENR
jgi:heme exporter protein CcmD